MKLKLFFQEDSTKEKENIKVRCLLFSITVMRLVTLQQDVLKRRVEEITNMKTIKKKEMKNMKRSTKVEKMMTSRAIRTKVRNLAILLKKIVIVSLACLMK